MCVASYGNSTRFLRVLYHIEDIFIDVLLPGVACKRRSFGARVQPGIREAWAGPANATFPTLHAPLQLRLTTQSHSMVRFRMKKATRRNRLA